MVHVNHFVALYGWIYDFEDFPLFLQMLTNAKKGQMIVSVWLLAKIPVVPMSVTVLQDTLAVIILVQVTLTNTSTFLVRISPMSTFFALNKKWDGEFWVRKSEWKKKIVFSSFHDLRRTWKVNVWMFGWFVCLPLINNHNLFLTRLEWVCLPIISHLQQQWSLYQSGRDLWM